MLSTTGLQLPLLRPDQSLIVRHPAKVKVLSMGRRWGKTIMGGAVCLATASQGGKVAWVVPTYKNARPLWRWAEATVAPLRKAGLASINRTDRLIEFAGGGFLGIYTADNEDSVRGEAFHLVIVDEAARIAEEVWTDAIQPTLADYGGDAILISTPKGRNWFWREWVNAQDASAVAASWRAPSSDNPNPRIQAAAVLARDRVSDRTYRQEWLAEFLEDGGGVFRNVQACATAQPQQGAIEGHEYVMGVDWGKLNDATVFSVIDVTTRQQAVVDRMRKVDYHVQLQRLQALYERFHPYTIIAERNSMGEPLIEQLQRTGLPVEPFLTSNQTKMAAIDALALAFERAELGILDDPVQIGELQAYEMERLPSGLTRYNAPQGMHDDCVMSLALAWQAVQVEPVYVAWADEDDDAPGGLGDWE